MKSARDNELPSATKNGYLDQKGLITEYIIQNLNWVPCVLMHGDLSTENIILDEEFYIMAYKPSSLPSVPVDLMQMPTGVLTPALHRFSVFP